MQFQNKTYHMKTSIILNNSLTFNVIPVILPEIMHKTKKDSFT